MNVAQEIETKFTPMNFTIKGIVFFEVRRDKGLVRFKCYDCDKTLVHVVVKIDFTFEELIGRVFNQSS